VAGFTCFGGTLFAHSGDWIWNAPLSAWSLFSAVGASKSGHAAHSLSSADTIILEGLGAFTIETLPLGFTPTTNLKARAFNSNAWSFEGGDPTAFACDVGGLHSGSDFLTGLVDLPDYMDWNLLWTGFFSFDITLPPRTDLLSWGSVSDDFGVIEITGDYEIIRNWYETASPCQPSEKHLVVDTPPAGSTLLERTVTPRIDSVVPPTGPTIGGTPITLHGVDFGDGATVAIDDVPATDVVVVNEFTITCVTPAHVAGGTDVIVTNLDGGHS
jgi:hypothetical protein